MYHAFVIILAAATTLFAIPSEALDLTTPDGTAWLKDISMAATLSDGTVLSSTDPRYDATVTSQLEGRQLLFTDREGLLDMGLTIENLSPRSVRLVAFYTNRGDDTLNFEQITPLSGTRPAPGGFGKMLHNAQQVGYYKDHERIVVPEAGQTYGPSYWTFAIDKPALTAGYLTSVHNMGQFVVTREEGALAFTTFGPCDGVVLTQGSTRESDPLFLSAETPMLRELERFADLAAKLNGVDLWEENFATWCSWYSGWVGHKPQRYLYTFRDGLETGIETQIPLIARHFKDRNAAWMRIVDDSAEMSTGIWADTVPAIPNGISRLVDMMREHGVHPAFWYTPVFYATRSEVFREHPRWFGAHPEEDTDPFTCIFYKNRTGLIDTSVPEAREHAMHTARQFRERGFEYVMSDFLVQHLYPDYDDPAMTKLEVHRALLEAIREGLGPDVYWLGCTGMPGPCMGLVDGMRISGDSFGGAGTPYAYYQSGLRWFYHRRLWLNDPDAIITRGHWDFEEKEYVLEDKGAAFNQGWMSWMALAGTVMTYGDLFEDLPQANIAVYKRVFPPMNIAGRPLDLLENDPYNLWGVRVGDEPDSYRLFGAFNYARDEAVHLSINLDEVAARTDGYGKPDAAPGAWLVWDFWNERLVPSDGHRMELDLAVNRGSLFSLREALGRPQLLGTTGHFSQGALEVTQLVYNDDNGTLKGKVRGNAGDPTRLYVHVPTAYSVEGARLGRETVPVVNHTPGVVALDVPATEKALRFQLRFLGEGRAPARRAFVEGEVAVVTKKEL